MAISNNEELEGIFKKHFSKIAENLDIDKTLANNTGSSTITNPVFNAIKNFMGSISLRTGDGSAYPIFLRRFPGILILRVERTLDFL